MNHRGIQLTAPRIANTDPGTKVTSESGEGYHIVVGGGFGENRKVGRKVFSGVTNESLGATLETKLEAGDIVTFGTKMF